MEEEALCLGKFANLSDTTLSNNVSMEKLPKAPFSSAKKLANVGENKTYFIGPYTKIL